MNENSKPKRWRPTGKGALLYAQDYDVKSKRLAHLSHLLPNTMNKLLPNTTKLTNIKGSSFPYDIILINSQYYNRNFNWIRFILLAFEL